ncbi:MAG: hypothetical protein HZR80_18470 [Candidatus Heimdallarchaeota archaeon]
MVPDVPLAIVIHKCYVPVFEGKPCHCWYIIPGLIFAIMLLIIFIWIPGVWCLIKKFVFRINHCSSGNDYPNIPL